MQKDALNNVHISDEQVMIIPEELKRQFPLSKAEQHAIAESRRTIADIIHGRDPRLLGVADPVPSTIPMLLLTMPVVCKTCQLN